mgnify:CR=1 FL=1
MEIEQIRQALERELGDKWRIEDGGSDSIFCIRSNTYPFSIDIELHMWQEHMLNTGLAAIGRALQSAAGETMIPLREAIDAVNEASQKCPESQWGMMYRSDAIAALQALGGGYET